MSVLSPEISRQAKPNLGWRWFLRLIQFVPWLTAGLFTSAALLKVHYLRNYPISDEGLFHSRMFSTVLLELEFIISALLIYGHTRRVGVVVASIGLAAFTFYNILAWLRGTQLCGCLGVISVNPATMASIDALFVLSLIGYGFSLGRRHRAVPRYPSARLQSSAVFASILPGIMVLGYGFSRYASNSGGAPKGIEIYPSVLNLGDVGEHGTKAGEFSIINHRAETTAITAILPDCSCTVAAATIKELATGDRAIVNVTFEANPYTK